MIATVNNELTRETNPRRRFLLLIIAALVEGSPGGDVAARMAPQPRQVVKVQSISDIMVTQNERVVTNATSI